MKRFLRQLPGRLLSAVLALILVLQWSCAPSPRTRMPPTTPMQEIYCTRIAVIAKPIEPQLLIKGVPHSKPMGAVHGAGDTLEGCISPLFFGGNITNKEMAILALAWLGACSIVGVFSGIGSAFEAPSASVIEKTEDAFKDKLIAQTLQEDFRQRIVTTAQAQGIAVAELPQFEILPAPEALDFENLRQQGVDTLFEVALRGINVAGDGLSLETTPLTISLYADVRTISVAKRSELTPHEFIYVGRSRTAKEWMADDNRLLAEEMDYGLGHLCDVIFFNYIRHASQDLPAPPSTEPSPLPTHSTTSI